MSIQNFLAGLNQFQQGIQQLQQGRLISKANQVVEQIRTSEAKDEEKRAQLQQLSQTVSLGLMQMGGTPQGALLASQILAPKEVEKPTSTFEAFITPGYEEKALQFEGFKEGVRENARIAANERVAVRQEEGFQRSEAARSSREQRATLTKFQQDFNKTTKDINKSLTQAGNAIKLLDSNSPLAATAIGTMMARASGEVGNLTAMERAAFEGRQDLISRVYRDLSIKGWSELPKGDREVIREVAQIYRDSGQELINDYGATLTNQLRANELFVDEDPTRLITNITGGRIKQFVDPFESQQNQVTRTAPASSPFKKGFIPN